MNGGYRHDKRLGGMTFDFSATDIGDRPNSGPSVPCGLFRSGSQFVSRGTILRSESEDAIP